MTSPNPSPTPTAKNYLLFLRHCIVTVTEIWNNGAVVVSQQDATPGAILAIRSQSSDVETVRAAHSIDPLVVQQIDASEAYRRGLRGPGLHEVK